MSENTMSEKAGQAQDHHTTTEQAHHAFMKVVLALSGLSLFFSGWAFVSSFDDDDFERQTQSRLACLELPGPNDCGLDGR